MTPTTGESKNTTSRHTTWCYCSLIKLIPKMKSKTSMIQSRESHPLEFLITNVRGACFYHKLTPMVGVTNQNPTSRCQGWRSKFFESIYKLGVACSHAANRNSSEKGTRTEAVLVEGTPSACFLKCGNNYQMKCKRPGSLKTHNSEYNLVCWVPGSMNN